MQFLKSILAVSALASITSAANTLTFISQDAKDRTIFFTSAYDKPQVEPVVLKGHSTIVAEIPFQWSGNFWGVIDGCKNTGTGMLGEMNFNAYSDLTFYDVSAIVVPTDIDNIKMIYPKNSNTPTAGCQSYETTCDNCYNVWNDNLASKASPETDFIVLVGTLPAKRSHARDISARAPEATTTQQ
jgi:hypothetical protein